MNTLTRAVPIAVVILTCWCLPSRSEDVAEQKIHTLTAKQDGDKLTVAKGDIVELKLGEQATGYRWTIKSNKSEVLKLVKEEKEENNDPKPGGEQMRVFRFKVESAGTSK